MTREAPKTGPSAPLTSDLAPEVAELGLCSCGASGLVTCRCEMGSLIRELLDVAYGLTAIVAYQETVRLQSRATSVLHAQKRILLLKMLDGWRGSEASFRKALGITWTGLSRLKS